MRGIIAVIVTIFAVMVGVFLIGGAAVEPLGDVAKEHNSGSKLGVPNVISNLYSSFFIGVPLVLIAGMLSWAALYYLRDERFAGGGR